MEEKKIAWVKWESVCLPKEKGGIGIRDLRKFNYALLGKWKWSFFHNKGELWARILDSKYGGLECFREAMESEEKKKCLDAMKFEACCEIVGLTITSTKL